MRFGADCYAYGLLVALGFVDLVIEASLKPYDFGADGADRRRRGRDRHRLARGAARPRLGRSGRSSPAIGARIREALALLQG